MIELVSTQTVIDDNTFQPKIKLEILVGIEVLMNINAIRGREELARIVGDDILKILEKSPYSFHSDEALDALNKRLKKYDLKTKPKSIDMNLVYKDLDE